MQSQRRELIWRFDGELLRLAGSYNVPPDYKDFLERNPIRPGRGTTSGRVALERRVVHTPDILARFLEYEFAEAARRAESGSDTLGGSHDQGGHPPWSDYYSED